MLGIGRMLEAIQDDKLGTFEFLFSSIITNSFNSPAEKIHRWLSPPDTSGSLEEASEKRQDNTCFWFLDGERFLEWQAHPGFLWVKGKGKLLSKLSEVEN
jgi:hypothetical protein